MGIHTVTLLRGSLLVAKSRPQALFCLILFYCFKCKLTHYFYNSRQKTKYYRPTHDKIDVRRRKCNYIKSSDSDKMVKHSEKNVSLYENDKKKL